MPIITLQRRARELGRIRIGQVVTGSNGKARPEKLDRFRFTAASKELIEKVATLYGGEVCEWQPQGGGAPGWEVVTAAARLPVLVPPQPVSQFFELWSGGGCQRRCDGQRELLTDTPCLCSPDPEERECKPTTRLNVVLRDVPGVGVWRLETHGFYAATELPAVAEMLAHGARYLEATLALEERVVKRDGRTRRFVVPTFEVDITFGELMAGQRGADAAELSAASPAELESGGLWQQILAAVPAEWTTAQTEEDFYRRSGARPEKATADQLRRHLTWLTLRQQPSAKEPAVERGTARAGKTTEERFVSRAQRVISERAESAAPPADPPEPADPPAFDYEAEIERCERELDQPGIRATYKRAGQERPADDGLRALIEYTGIAIKEKLEAQRQAASDATAQADIAEMAAEELARLKTRDELRAEMFARLAKGGITDSTSGRAARLRVCSRLPVVGRVPEITSTDELSDLEVAQIIVALRRHERAGDLTETLAAMSEVTA